MPYAQINYQEKVGNSNLTIAEIGCFDTADCNLAEAFGYEIDPATLNAFYTANGCYSYDLTDRANDDITWSTITRRFPDIVVSRIVNNPGWPQTANAIVKFVYTGHSGATVTHFCKVADPNAHLIIDSWDGKEKAAGPGTYYGEPVAFAEYVKNSPTPPAPAPEASATAPADFTPLNTQVTVMADTLMVRSGPGTNFPGGVGQGSTDGNVHKGVKVGITGWAHGEKVVGNDIWLRTSFGHWVWSGGTNFSLVSIQEAPAPTPPPAAPTPPPASAPPAVPANTTYTKLETPLNLIINKNTSKWDLGFTNDAHAISVENLAQGTPFVAFGKAQRTDGDKPAYFMTQEDFGNADQSGTPTHNVGVNTVDLSPAPAPQAPTPPATPSEPSAPAAADDSQKVDVKVNTDPNAWKNIVHLTDAHGRTIVEDFVATANTTVHELDETLPVTPEHPAMQQLLKGQTIPIAGFVTKNSIKYYLSENSVNNHHYYGIPEVSVKKLVPAMVGDESGLDELISDIENDAETVVKGARTIAKAATSAGLLKRLTNRKQK